MFDLLVIVPASSFGLYPHRFGKHSHDELSILVPLSQCCRSDFWMFYEFLTVLFAKVSVSSSCYRQGLKDIDEVSSNTLDQSKIAQQLLKI